MMLRSISIIFLLFLLFMHHVVFNTTYCLMQYYYLTFTKSRIFFRKCFMAELQFPPSLEILQALSRILKSDPVLRIYVCQVQNDQK